MQPIRRKRGRGTNSGGGGGKNSNGNNKRPKRKKGGKKKCPKGFDCPHQHQMQHTQEFSHASKQETEANKRKRARDDAFATNGRKLGKTPAQRLGGGRSSSSSGGGGGGGGGGRYGGHPRDAQLAAALARSGGGAGRNGTFRTNQYTPGLSSAISGLGVNSEKPKKRRRVRYTNGSGSADGDVVDLVSPSPPTRGKSAGTGSDNYSNNMYGAHASEKSKQDLEYDVSMALDRSKRDEEISKQQRLKEELELSAIMEQSRVEEEKRARAQTAMDRQATCAYWQNQLQPDPSLSSSSSSSTSSSSSSSSSSNDNLSNICLRFPNGQRCSRYFHSNAPCSQLVAYAGSCMHMIPEELYDDKNWGVFTAHPRNLISGAAMQSTLREAGLHPRALLHVGQLPMEYDRNEMEYSSSGSQGDAMDLDL